MEYSPDKADNDTDQPAVRTATVLQNIANSIKHNKQFVEGTFNRAEPSSFSPN